MPCCFGCGREGSATLPGLESLTPPASSRGARSCARLEGRQGARSCPCPPFETPCVARLLRVRRVAASLRFLRPAARAFSDFADPIDVIARLDRAIQY